VATVVRLEYISMTPLNCHEYDNTIATIVRGYHTAVFM